MQPWIPHAVPLHVGVPFCTEQTFPQPPQALTLFVVAVSHPLATFASQLPKPAAHMIVHEPFEQPAEPLVVLQAFMQAPQCVVFVAVLISQPFVLVPSQLANVPVHEVISQVPVAHDVFAFGYAHVTPQPPQLLRVLRFVSQPFAYKPSQSEKPGLHERTAQLPAVHVGVPLATKQVIPQPPQWFVSVVVVVSQPFIELPSQSRLPAAHIDTPQVLLRHAGVPPCGGQTMPQVPQLLTFDVVLISHPFATLRSQLAKPTLQVIEHMPVEHAGVPLFVLHAAPQLPQF